MRLLEELMRNSVFKYRFSRDASLHEIGTPERTLKISFAHDVGFAAAGLFLYNERLPRSQDAKSKIVRSVYRSGIRLWPA
jgi:hypothetical protein